MSGVVQSRNLERVFEMQQEVQDVKEILINEIDTDAVLKRNIERAELLLDRIQDEINNGVMNPQLLSAASSLITAVTQAANSFITNSTSLEMIAIKQEGMDIKRKELELKEAVKSAQASTPLHQTNIQNNVVVSSREEILRLMSGEQLTPE